MPLKKIHLIIRDATGESRRKAEELIRQGRVTLNGQVALDPYILADPEKDYIKVDGKLLRPRHEEKLYFLFNKPRFVVSTFSDPEGRPCLGDFVKKIGKRLFAAGRLDFDAEGLMLLTNDGALVEKLTHPSHAVPRTYLVKVKGSPTDEALVRIRPGMSLGEGDRLGHVQWMVIKRQKSTTWLRLVLYEGKRNEIKRIFFRIGHPVRKLRRIGFGPFSLGKLPSGTWRPLTPKEQEKLGALLREAGM
ncbi:MAG: rRNA pseudouridine synthase [Desulfomonile sp.]|nr:rRNA pseudouridine synthase [Desulfomonile sp.]